MKHVFKVSFGIVFSFVWSWHQFVSICQINIIYLNLYMIIKVIILKFGTYIKTVSHKIIFTKYLTWKINNNFINALLKSMTIHFYLSIFHITGAHSKNYVLRLFYLRLFAIEKTNLTCFLNFIHICQLMIILA